MQGELIKAAPDGLFGRAIVRYGQQRYWRTDSKGSCVLCVTACTGGRQREDAPITPVACKGMLGIEGDAYESVPLRRVCEWACEPVGRGGRIAHLFLIVLRRNPPPPLLLRSNPDARL